MIGAIGAWVERASNLASALADQRAARERTTWSRDRRAQWQRERLAALVAHATEHTAFYREQYGGRVRGEVELQDLPVTTKDALMDRFDDAVADPRLRFDALSKHAAEIRGDELYLGQYRVMVSSGSAGRKGLFVWDRAAWRAGLLCGSLRMSEMAGLSPRLPRPRIATVAAGDGRHMSFRGGASMDVGVYRTRRFAASSPQDALCRALDAWDPRFVLGYPSALAALADAQRAGQLHLSPTSVITSSEVRTDGMAAAIEAAWGVRPFDCYALSETGIAAVDCAHHCGLHVFDDLVIVEVVDDAGRAVPDGAPGARVLVTNLTNAVQPIVRYEVSDLLTVTGAPCACGSTLPRIVALDGRSDDVLELPGPSGRVRVHPIHLRGALGREPAVVQYQVDQRPDRLDVRVVPARAAPPDLAARVADALRQALHAAGAAAPVEVTVVAAIPREDGPGKLKLVRALRPG